VALGVMAICLLLTQSRSGVLALLGGAGVVYAHRPRRLGRPGVWIAVGAVVLAMAGAAVLVGVDPTLLWTRFTGIADTADTSNRQHLEVFQYGLQLIGRYPLTGVGLGNFGLFYGSERDAWFTKMMSHCAPLSAFAESGLPGGIAFLAVWYHILRRISRFRPAPGDAEADALRVGLLASVTALLISNVFYDYILRTFVWVLVGLALCTVRLTARARADAAAMSR
jgi:O-antigen ligase